MAKTTNREANIVVKVTDAGAKVNLDKVRTAIEGIGPEATKSAQKFVDAFRNVEKAEESLTRKISDGRTVTERDGARMIQAFAILEAQIRATFGSIDKAPAEVQAAFGQMQQAADRTTAKVRELTDAVHDQKGQLKEGGEHWGGLGDAMNKAMGPAGAIQAKLALGFAAFKEGWQIGQQLNKMFGTDMSLWEETVGRFGQKANAILKALSDNVVGFANLFIAIITGNIDGIKKAFAEITDNASKSFKTITEAVTKYGTEWDSLHPKVKKATEATKENKEETEKLATTLVGAGEEQKKYKQAIDDLAAALANQTLELQHQREVAMDSEHMAIDRTSQAGYEARAVADLTAQLAAQKIEVAELTRRYGDQDPVVIGAREKQDQLAGSLASSKQRMGEASAEAARYEAQHKAATTAVEKATTAQAGLIKELGSVYDQAPKAAGAIASVGTAGNTAATGTDKFAAAVGKVADAVRAPTETLDQFGDELLNVRDMLLEIIDLTPRFVDAMNDIHQASKTAAGTDEDFIGPTQPGAPN